MLSCLIDDEFAKLSPVLLNHVICPLLCILWAQLRQFTKLRWPESIERLRGNSKDSSTLQNVGGKISLNMVRAEEAINSDDPKTVKRARRSINTQISCELGLLVKELAKETDGDYNYDQISPELIKSQRKKLEAHFDLIQKLHERYLDVREEGINDVEEQSRIKEDINFMADITSKVCPVLDKVNNYEECLVSFLKAKNFVKTSNMIQATVATAKKEFQFISKK